MGLPIPIIDSIINLGKTALDKIWIDKGDAAKIELTREQMQRHFELAIKEMDRNGELKQVEATFKEQQAQRDYAHDQFGKMEVLKEMGMVGKIIALGRASIRWIITAGSMFFTWKILNLILTDALVASLAAGTLGASTSAIVGLIICLVVGVPVFYVSGISVEKIMKVRDKI